VQNEVAEIPRRELDYGNISWLKCKSGRHLFLLTNSYYYANIVHILKGINLYMMDYTFTARLALLVGCDIALAITDSFIPHEFGPVRAMVAFVELIFMAATMTMTVRRVLEDY
jgi:hypothetical protein